MMDSSFKFGMFVWLNFCESLEVVSKDVSLLPFSWTNVCFHPGNVQENELKACLLAELFLKGDFVSEDCVNAQVICRFQFLQSWNESLGGGFKYFLFSPLLGEMIQFD